MFPLLFNPTIPPMFCGYIFSPPSAKIVPLLVQFSILPSLLYPTIPPIFSPVPTTFPLNDIP